MFCQDKKKALVSWQWENEEQKILETSLCPVNVLLTPIAQPGNTNWIVRRLTGEYLWRFQSSSYKLFLDKTFNDRDSLGSSLLKGVNELGQTQWQSAWSFYVMVEPEFITGCRIDITDSTGKIFSESRNNKKCPVYNVRCNDDCPDGYIKCNSDSYPGYCCLPCNEIKSEIKSITAIVRGINNG